MLCLGLDALAVDRVGDASQRPISPWLRGFLGLHSFASTMMVIQLYTSALKREHPRMMFGDDPRSGRRHVREGEPGDRRSQVDALPQTRSQPTWVR